MKLSIICKTTEWQVEKLKEAAADFSFDLEVRDISSKKEIENLGDIILWRSSSLGSGSKRKSVMEEIMKSRILINKCLAIFPNATNKFFQQEYVRKSTNTVNTIDSFLFETKEDLLRAIINERIKFPFIQKPVKGSKGEGVELIGNKDELEKKIVSTKGNVYQNFIKNSGDYRVFMMGGKVLGVMKRIAKDGGFLNNISKGGSALHITDPDILKPLHHIGSTVASIFKLTLCGVDVIYDENQKRYFFLEVNTVPQWKGFQAATGVDVAKEILLHCQELMKRGKNDTRKCVLDFYNSNVEFLWDKKFHYFSRMYLWNKEEFYRAGLDKLKSFYLGKSDYELESNLRNIFLKTREHGEKMVAREERMVIFKKYNKLENFLGILFKYLFALSLYEKDVKNEISKLVSDNDLLQLKTDLENDDEALRILSTHAINYFYLVREYLGSSCIIDIKKLYKIGKFYQDEGGEQALTLQIYFYTHCIIGASGFYSHEIPLEEIPIYKKMLDFMDELIMEKYDDISLDNKFEFLVCAKLCNYSASSEKNIFEEAGRSFSFDGNFLVDTLNKKTSPDARNSFAGSEHRNVLYLMASSPYIGK